MKNHTHPSLTKTQSPVFVDVFVEYNAVNSMTFAMSKKPFLHSYFN